MEASFPRSNLHGSAFLSLTELPNHLHSALVDSVSTIKGKQMLLQRTIDPHINTKQLALAQTTTARTTSPSSTYPMHFKIRHFTIRNHLTRLLTTVNLHLSIMLTKIRVLPRWTAFITYNQRLAVIKLKCKCRWIRFSQCISRCLTKRII